MLHRNSYAAGHFEMQIDGQASSAYVKSVEGGWSRANLSDEPSGPSSARAKQITSVEIEPITVELGLLSARDMLRWIQRSWSGQEHRRCDGQITYANFDMRTMFEHHFYRALITETTFPTLDGASKDGGYLKCKLQPESVKTLALGVPGPKIASQASSRQKMWTPSAFRLHIDGVEDMQYVNKLESFTVSLQTQKLQTGGARFAEFIPTRIKFPNLTGTISMRYADSLLRWHNEFIRTSDGAGTQDRKAQRSGAIDFLSADRKQTLFRINLSQVGLLYVGAEPAKANEEQIKRLKFELYVHGMTIDDASFLGFM
jgi:hypothetical protein